MKNQSAIVDASDPNSSVLPDSHCANPAIEIELSGIFDRYAAALDAGDNEAAEAILAAYPAIGEEFRAPLRGLYVLGRSAREKHFDSQHADSVGRGRLGDFEIETELGRGGMGIVYAATQISLRRRVALKVLPFTAVLDPRQVARFRNEAQAAASLHHPDIVPVYAVGCERGVHYYCMQLIDGQSLEQFIDQLRERSNQKTVELPSTNQFTGALSTVVSIQSLNYVRNVVEIAARAAAAIDFAHRQGIVHRDLKPSNLLLDHTGKIWVTDFGLARCRGNSNLTSQGDQLGTARYMSPEQAAGRTHQIDYRTDIYSLGLTFYELLTLHPAFEAPNREQLLAAIESREPVPMRTLNSSIPIDLETVINKAIAKTPSDRYQSAQDFADDLLRCWSGKPILAKRQTLVDRVYKSIAKRKWVFAGLAIAGLALVITTSIVASIFYQQRQREKATADLARFYLRQAHQAVDRFGGLLSDELAEIPGTDSVRARLLGEAIAYYDDFLEFAADSSALRFERADAYSQLASLHERAGNDKLSIKYFETAIEQFGKLLNDPVSSKNSRLEQAICLDKLGLLFKQQGDYPQSLRALENALAQLAALDPQTRQQSDVIAATAQVRANLGMLYWAQGDLNEATAQFEQALEQLQFPTDASIVDTELLSAYLKINGNFVAVLTELDLDRAEQVLRQSLRALEHTNSLIQRDDSQVKSVATADSVDKRGSTTEELITENASHIADMQNNLAIMLGHKGQFEQAESLAKSATEFWQAEFAERPFNLKIAERLATAKNTLGEIYWRNNVATFGDECFCQAETLLRSVVERQPDRPEPQSRLAGILHNRSLVAFRNNDVNEATRLVRLAIELQSKAAILAPDNIQYRKFLESHQKTLETFLTSVQTTR